MSKAFTSEETPELEPVVRPPPRLAPGEVRYVTPEGRDALRAEFERLAADREAAAALPDAERPARIGDVDRRRLLVEATLAALTVLGPEAAPEGKVAFATWVTVEDADGRRTTWRIVGPDESAPRRGLLGVDSPVARALLGRAAGDTVEVVRPGGTVELTVVAVSCTPPP
jgi:transcription elongation factor GreB